MVKTDLNALLFCVEMYSELSILVNNKLQFYVC